MSFFLGTPLDDDRQLLDLTDTIVDEDSYFLVQRLDRLYLAVMPQWGSIKIGRQAITWGNGFIFNPFDLFNPFPPAAIDRDYKVGDDMLNLQSLIPKMGDLQALYVARRDPDTDNVETDQASLAGKLHVAAGTTEFEFMDVKHFEDYVVGAGSTGYIADAAWRVDGTWTFLDEDPSGILQPYATWDITQNMQLTAGLNVSYGAKDSEFGGFTLPGSDIHTKSPDNAYLWLFYYF